MKRSAKSGDAAVRRAIARAERLLPGIPAPEGEEDARWQAIIALDPFIESHPEPLWEFVLRWGKHPQEDLRMALACCLLEHLLEHHFDLIFPRLAEQARRSRRFAWMASMCDQTVMGSAKDVQWAAFERLLCECLPHRAALQEVSWWRARQRRARKDARRRRASTERWIRRMRQGLKRKRSGRK